MTWEELVEKAKEFGYITYETVIASNDYRILATVVISFLMLLCFLFIFAER